MRAPRTFDIPELDRIFVWPSYDFSVLGGACQERATLRVRGSFSLGAPPYYETSGLETLDCWIFGRPYRLKLNTATRPSIEHADRMRDVQLDYEAFPITEDLRHPVLRLRKIQVSYAPWRS